MDRILCDIPTKTYTCVLRIDSRDIRNADCVACRHCELRNNADMLIAHSEGHISKTLKHEANQIGIMYSMLEVIVSQMTYNDLCFTNSEVPLKISLQRENLLVKI